MTSTLDSPTTPQTEPTDHRVITPTVRRSLVRALFWVCAGAFAFVVALGMLSLQGTQSEREPLDPQSATPSGSQAVARVLEDQGVTVTPVTSLAAATAAVGDEGTTTLVLHDSGGLLSEEQIREVLALSDRVVLIDPGTRELAEVAGEVESGGPLPDNLTADCAVGSVERAGSVYGGGTGYTVGASDDGVVACFESDDEYGLIEVVDGHRTVIVFGLTGALRNESVARAGNAALSLGVLGERAELVWYRPSLTDIPGGTAADASPGWVVPVSLLAVLTAVAAAVWRGRRFGPLIIENLPVIVRSNETVLGRARLYERSSSRLRALDALRIGTISRLATACGLPSVATVDEVITAVADVTARHRTEVAGLLLDTMPTTDRELIALSDALLVIETDVASALRG